MDRIYKKIDWNVSGNGGSWTRAGLAAEELIKHGVLNKPDSEKPMTGGVFCVKGDVLFI